MAISEKGKARAEANLAYLSTPYIREKVAGLKRDYQPNDLYPDTSYDGLLIWEYIELANEVLFGRSLTKTSWLRGLGIRIKSFVLMSK